MTLERLMQEDPTFNGLSLYVLAADPVKLRSVLEEQAASGRLVPQMLLGEAYIPPECTFLPYKTAPTDCPQDTVPKNLLRLEPSFDAAIHWLTLASQQGSGEASEVLAQVMDRAIKSEAGSTYGMADVAHFHAVARAQGFDLQDVEISCYTLDPGRPGDRLLMAEIPAEFHLTASQLDALHAAGATGTLRFGSASIQPGLSTLLRHPEGPKVNIRVILSGGISREVLVPIADRVDVVYLQMGDRMVTVPASYQNTPRKLSIFPTAKEQAEATFQMINGRFGGVCASR
jgi:hypothetical protein